MKQTDTFLIGMVGGVILLIVSAFAIVLLRPQPTYQQEGTPEGVAYNYLFALQERDYERAYSYLWPGLEGYPASAEDFTSDVKRYDWIFATDASTTIAIDATRYTAQRAIVTVRETTFYENGLLSSEERISTFEMTIIQDPESGLWKISASDSYWRKCWGDKGGC